MKQTIGTLSELSGLGRASGAKHDTVKSLPCALILRMLLLIALLFVEAVSVLAQSRGSGGHSLRFDGADDFVEVPHVRAYEMVMSEAFTIRAQFMIEAFAEKSQVIVKKLHDQQGVDTWRLEVTDQGAVVFFLKDLHLGYSEYAGEGFEVVGTNVTIWSDAGVVRAGEPVVIQVVYDDNGAGEHVRLYVNGYLVREMAPLRPSNTVPQGRFAQSVGSIIMGEGLFGEINQIAWYSGAFLPVEGGMGELPEDALANALGIWHFEERTEVIKDDVAQIGNHGTLFNADLTSPQIEANGLGQITRSQLVDFVTAFDNVDGQVPAAIVGGRVEGEGYVLTYRAVDVMGNVAVAEFPVAISDPFPNTYVTLQMFDGRNVGIDEGEEFALGVFGEPARFRIEDLGLGAYALRTFEGRYVSGEDNVDGYVLANRESCGPWETLVLIPVGGDVFAIQTSSEKYVAVHDENGGRLQATATEISEAAMIRVVYALPWEGYVGLLASDGQWVCADQDREGQLRANRPGVWDWETFYLKDLGAGKYALRAFSGQWVAKEKDHGGHLMGNRAEIGPWEVFDVIVLGENTFALRAVNGTYVSVNRAEWGQLLGSDEVGAEETFVINPLAQ